MEPLMHILEWLLENLVELATILLELFGISVLVATAFKSFWMWLHNDRNHVRLVLAQGIALGLEFKLGGEVLRTVVVRDWQELGILGAIIVLRAILTFVIHWEIKNEKKELEMENQRRQE